MNILDVILLSQRLDALPVGRSCRSGRITRIRHGFAEFLEVSFHRRGSECRQQPTGCLPHVLVGMGHPAGDMHHAASSRSDGLHLSIAQGRKLELALYNVKEFLWMVLVQGRTASRGTVASTVRKAPAVCEALALKVTTSVPSSR